MKICPMASKCCYGNINGEECAYNLTMLQEDECPQQIEEYEIWEIAQDRYIIKEERDWY